MKGITGSGGGGGISDLCKSASLIRISGFLLISVVFFYLGKHFSDGSAQQLVFFTSHQNPETSSAAVALSPNLNKTFDVSSITNDTASSPPQNSQIEPQQAAAPPPPSPSPPPPPPALQRMGVVDESGKMTDNFEVGEYDPELVDNWSKTKESEGLESDGKGDKVRVRVKKFPLCPSSMREYIPCLDNEEAIKQLNSTDKGERFERHCPEEGKGLNCLIPAPKGYRSPIPWPRSRDEVTFSVA